LKKTGKVRKFIFIHQMKRKEKIAKINLLKLNTFEFEVIDILFEDIL